MDFGEVIKFLLRLIGVLFLAIQAQQVLNHLSKTTKESYQGKENDRVNARKNILLIIADDLGELS